MERRELSYHGRVIGAEEGREWVAGDPEESDCLDVLFLLESWRKNRLRAVHRAPKVDP